MSASLADAVRRKTVRRRKRDERMRNDVRREARREEQRRRLEASPSYALVMEGRAMLRNWAMDKLRTDIIAALGSPA